jgi:hypothetical protein
MKLYTNGCSFTWGGDIIKSLHDPTGQLLDETATGEINDYRLSVTWPKHLSDKLHCTEFHNHSLGCGSNARIVRKTLDYFIPKIQNNIDVSDYIAVIQWTDPSRYEYYNQDEKSWVLAKHDMVVYENKKISDDDDFALRKSYFRNTNDKTWVNTFYSQILTLGFFFKSHNIKHLFTMIHSDVNAMNDYQISYLDQNFNWYKNSIKLCCIVDMQVDKTSSNHPSLLGHVQIADNLYNWINANKNQ